MRMRRCYNYRLMLRSDYPYTPLAGRTSNSLKDPDVVNLHLHGLHLDGDAPADDVFTQVGDPQVPGGEAQRIHEYLWRLPCDQQGGTFWWHVHWHGAQTLQVG